MKTNTTTVPREPRVVELEPPARDAATPARRGRRWWAWVALVALVAAAVAYRFAADTAKPATPATAAAPPSVPVLAASARTGEMPVILTGLGTVTAFNTVTVKSRVDGELMRVAFQEGQLVQQGDLLAEIDPRPFQVQLAQAQGQMARDAAQLKDAQINLSRFADLLTKEFISKQQYDDQAAQVGQYEGAVKSDQATIDNAKLQLTYAHITAPISGRVGFRLVDAGNMVHATDTSGLVVITQVQPISVFFTLPEDQLPLVLVKLAAGAKLQVEAYDRAGTTRIATGSLLTADNQIDPSTGTSRLKAVFDNRDNALFPNQFVNVRLLLDVDEDAVVVPAAAVQRGPQGTYVYVVKADQTVEVRPVSVGPTEGGQTSITKGVAPGEVVVTDGVDKLRAGTAVRVKDAAAAPAPPPHA